MGGLNRSDTAVKSIQRTKALKVRPFGSRTESIQQDAEDCSFFRAESFREQVQLRQTLKNQACLPVSQGDLNSR